MSEMKSIPFKLNLLSRIAKELNERNVAWAVGTSAMLYFHGIVTEFHDIDIMVKEDDCDVAKEVLSSLGEMQQPNPNCKYKTRYFGEFIVDGVDVDIIAGFVILDEEKEYYFPLQSEAIRDFTEINGITIPLQTVGEWHNYYSLMGRADKVKLIADWLERNNKPADQNI